MTTLQFEKSVNREIWRMMNLTKPYAIQVCNAGKWPEVESQEDYNTRMDERDQQGETLPQSFEDWIKQGNDAIDDPGGNIIPSRVLANHDQYDNTKHPFE